MPGLTGFCATQQAFFVLLLFVTCSLMYTNADFNPGQFWKSVKTEMMELEKMADHMSDTWAMMHDDHSAEKKAVEDSEPLVVASSEENASQGNDSSVSPTSAYTYSSTVAPTIKHDKSVRTTVRPSARVPSGSDDNDDDDSDVDIEELNPFSGDMFSEIFGHQFPSMFSILRAEKPWWHGPHVCVNREEQNKTKEESELGSGPQQIVMFGASQFTTCKQMPNKYICTTVVSEPSFTKTVSVTYQCCHGYRRLRNKASNTCSKMEMKPAIDVLANMDAKEFISFVKASGLEEKLDAQNLTIFAPTDSAMKSYEEKMQNDNQVDWQARRRRQLGNDIDQETNKDATRDLVLSHMTPHLLELADFTNERVLLSENNSTLRLNMFYGRESPVVTVNCAPVKSGDNFATSSVIHSVGRVVPTVNKSLLQLLDQPQFSQFKTLLESNNLLHLLEKDGPFTVFAPTNDAIDKLDEGLRAKYNRGEACIKTVLKHHILSRSFCSAATNASSRISMINVGGDWLHIHAEETGVLMLDNKARVVTPDMVATNGVVHAIDKILSPKTAKPVSELLVETNHTQWIKLMEQAGVIDELNNAKNMTLFVPSESALTSAATQARLATLDDAALRDVILYHAAKYGCSSIGSNNDDDDDDDDMESFLPSQKLRVNAYSPIPVFSSVVSRLTVECARVLEREGKACNSAVYVIDRLIFPPNGTILQLIDSDSRLTTLRQVIKGTKLEEELKGLSENSYTFLAPSDEAFKKLSKETQEKLVEDKELADVVLRRHVVPEIICCTGVGMTPWPFTKSVDTLSGKGVEVNRDNSNSVRFAGNKVTKCDQVASDGIVHIVSNVFMPKSSSSLIKTGSIVFGNPGTEVHLYGV